MKTIIWKYGIFDVVKLYDIVVLFQYWWNKIKWHNPCLFEVRREVSSGYREKISKFSRELFHKSLDIFLPEINGNFISTTSISQQAKTQPCGLWLLKRLCTNVIVNG